MKIEKSILAAVLVSLTMLVGCATGGFKTAQCPETDWYAKGKEDAETGRSHQLFPQYAKVCKEGGHTADKKKYQAGQKDGLRTYCTKENAERVGRRGDLYFGQCKSTNKTFGKTYRKYRNFYLDGQQVQIDSQISSLKNQMYSAEKHRKSSLQSQIRSLESRKRTIQAENRRQEVTGRTPAMQ